MNEMHVVSGGTKNQGVYLNDVNTTHEGFVKTRASEDSMFNDVTIVERTNLIELKSNVNVISNLRDLTSTTDGTITASDGEYVLATTGTANANVRLDSAEIGRYQPGFAAEAGIGVRAPDTMTGQMEQRWGYYDTNDGFFFGKDATGTFIGYRRVGGDDVKVYQSDWNNDTMDGTDNAKNPSGQILTVTEGNIYQIRFSWYGYGIIEWRVVTTDIDSGEQITVTVHRFNPTNTNSIANPNLPLRAEVLNDTTATAQTMYVAGRQFSILGRYNPRRRVTSQYRLQLNPVGTTFLPTVSFRRKSSYLQTSVKIEGVDIIADADVIVQIRANPSLTGASYITPTDHTASETAVEADISASAISGGDVIYETIISSSGTGVNAKGSANRPLLPFDLINAQPASVCVRTITGTTATVSTAFRVTEEW